MAVFASRSPEDLNIDPEPIVRPSDGRRGGFRMRSNLLPGEHGPYGLCEQMEYKPRPEYTPETTHPYNPILIELRNGPDGSLPEGWGPAEAMLFDLDGMAANTVLRSGSTPSPDHVEHARRVLIRLVRLEAGTASA